MTRGGQPVHWSTVAHQILTNLKPLPEPEPDMTPHIAPGTTAWTQRISRAHLPDGRIKDSEPVDVDMATTVSALKTAFGRYAFPPGTRFERLERQVTVTATEWQVVDSKEGAA